MPKLVTLKDEFHAAVLAAARENDISVPAMLRKAFKFWCLSEEGMTTAKQIKSDATGLDKFVPPTEKPAPKVYKMTVAEKEKDDWKRALAYKAKREADGFVYDGYIGKWVLPADKLITMSRDKYGRATEAIDASGRNRLKEFTDFEDASGRWAVSDADAALNAKKQLERDAQAAEMLRIATEYADRVRSED